ncbi:MAG: cell division cycle-associated 7 family protein [archaeon]|nr:cell division cycle-associated 7 family protein [archaeon]
MLSKTNFKKKIIQPNQKQPLENNLGSETEINHHKFPKKDQIRKILENNHCHRTYCHSCLKGNYDIIVENTKNLEHWNCPYCCGDCFCTRCTRYDTILRLIAEFLSIEGGDINWLKNYLISQNPIIKELEEHLVLNNIFIVRNDPRKTPKENLYAMFERENNFLNEISNEEKPMEGIKRNLTFKEQNEEDFEYSSKYPELRKECLIEMKNKCRQLQKRDISDFLDVMSTVYYLNEGLLKFDKANETLKDEVSIPPIESTKIKPLIENIPNQNQNVLKRKRGRPKKNQTEIEIIRPMEPKEINSKGPGRGRKKYIRKIEFRTDEENKPRVTLIKRLEIEEPIGVKSDNVRRLRGHEENQNEEEQ